ncbi:tudor and KH domain-containing protein isoform X2 [Eleutherodactylus coqui]|uniref:tudor and KH domain-containing protein isoform X2 n=1 Tax=Eleutherodactylus coqui TaxID=57060 RepID=UPI003462B7CB
MERWSSLSTGQKVAVALGVSAGAALLYVWYARPRTAPHQDELCVTVPRHAAELIIGQDGALTDQLRTGSHARIVVSAAPDGVGDRELTIRGSPAQVRQTRQLLHGILQDGAALRVELHFPAISMGRIIGQGGERIREITRSSGARIECERQAESSGATRRITVSGSCQQVEAAKTLLQKASEEAAAVQRRAAESSTFRSRRKEIIAVKKEDGQRPQEGEKQPQTMDYAVPSPDYNFQADEFVDVYMSAIENPEHFWIQILGSRSSQLDKLTTEMSDHYQRQKRGSVPEVQVGDIVAAPFHSDKFWYRAEVLGFLKNGNVDLYYVDYGDNWDTLRENLYPLRSDFLSLPFQAIECCLSGVAPNGGTWSDQALDAFDTLSHCAEWKPLLAKISSFPSPEVSCFQIQLYDPSTDPMLDIGLELIRQGHAIECRVSPTKAEDDECLVSRLLEEVANLSKGSEPVSFSSGQEEGHLTSDGSVEEMRADVNPSPDHTQNEVSIPSPGMKSVEEADSLEQSILKLNISGSDHSLPDASSSSTSSYRPITSSSTEYSAEASCSSSCTTSEEQSFGSSSLEDSSIYSPRGCFYYMADEAFNSSLCTSSSGDVITISSDSEEESGKVQTDERKAAMSSDVFLSSSSDVIVIEDES